MPRHEFYVKRVPKESLTERGNADTSHMTVAALRSRLGQRIRCFNCDEEFDLSSLAHVWERWGPDTLVTYGHRWVREPNDPRDLRPRRPEGAQCRLPRKDGKDGAGPGAGKT